MTQISNSWHYHLQQRLPRRRQAFIPPRQRCAAGYRSISDFAVCARETILRVAQQADGSQVECNGRGREERLCRQYQGRGQQEAGLPVRELEWILKACVAKRGTSHWHRRSSIVRESIKMPYADLVAYRYYVYMYRSTSFTPQYLNGIQSLASSESRRQ